MAEKEVEPKRKKFLNETFGLTHYEKWKKDILIPLRYTKKNLRRKLDSKRKVVEKKADCKEYKHLGFLHKIPRLSLVMPLVKTRENLLSVVTRVTTP